VRVLGESSLAPDREATGIETEGTIEFVSPSIDPATETIRTRLVIDNRDKRLKSGSHAMVLIEPVVPARDQP
jgi:multidrug efflux pump subunit AcrA (membrane-fusion protein)